MGTTLDSLWLGFSVALQPAVLWYAFLGCVVGTLVGVLPGIGPLAGISILLPITFGLDATNAIVMLAGIYYGSQYGGSTTSILLRIPGEASSVMTCIDGNAMARKGRAGAALCIAAVGSWIAGTFGVIVLTLIAPPLATIALKFGPPEYTALLALGLLFLAYMSTSSLVRTLLMAALGLLLGMIGIDPLSGHFRFSFDIPELGDGIGIVPVAVGLFGLGEILATPSHTVTGDVVRPKLRELWPNREEWRQSAMPIARGTVMGFLIGIIPGSAHIISSFLSYAVEKKVSKHPEEFGHGAVAGVAGPESANNAASTGAFVPMLALGIPTGPVTAVLMAALMIHGVPPGPTLVNDHPDVFWGFVASMYVGNLMLLALNLPLVGLFVNLLRIPYAYLYPLIIMFCIIGVYEVAHSIVDVWIMLIMGVVGYALKKFSFDPAPLVLGLVIAPIFEMSLRQSLIMSDGNWLIFVTRPIAGTLMAVCAVLLVMSAISMVNARRDCHAENTLRELRINLRKLRRDGLTHQPQCVLRRRWRLGHMLRPVELESRILDHFLDRMPRMHAFELEALDGTVEREQAAVGHQRNRPAGAMHIRIIAAGRRDEAYLRHQRTARVLDAEQDYLRHHVVEVAGAERAGEAHARLIVVADADQIDVALSVDLAAGKKEHIDATLTGAIEQFAPAIGEEHVAAAAEQRHVRLAAAALACEQRRGCGDRRGIADRHVAHVADQPDDHVGEKFFGAEVHLRRRAWRRHGCRDSARNPPALRRAWRSRPGARRQPDSDRAAAAARRRAARSR
jgi:putative tricarboxylic transport membrane protein